MKLVSTLPLRRDESGRLEHVEVLRDGLPRQAQAVLHRQSGAELKQRLAIPLVQFVENRSPRRSDQCLEDIGHCSDNRQVTTCLSRDAPTLGQVFEIGEVLMPARRPLVRLEIVEADDPHGDAAERRLLCARVAGVELDASIVVRISMRTGGTPKRLTWSGFRNTSSESSGTSKPKACTTLTSCLAVCGCLGTQISMSAVARGCPWKPTA